MSALLTSTPRQDGFRMPGEFEPHDGTWMLFPERLDVWRDRARPGQKVFADVAEAIAQFEPVTMGVSAKNFDRARGLLSSQVMVVEIPYNDSWMRDCGPTFLVNDQGGVRGVDWEFNAWGGLEGGLYSPWDDDNQVAQRVLTHAGMDCYKTDLINEGGAITVDGEGTLITTKSVLLNPNRNPGHSQAEIEEILSNMLNLNKIIWLEGEADDETDGHVDGVCCFVRPGVLLLSWTDDTDSPDYHVCRDVEKQLRAVKDGRGRPFEIIKLPLASLPPATKEETEGMIVTAGSYPRLVGDPVFGGYINFYLANGGVIVPQFDVPEDEVAVKVLQKTFPNRKVVGVHGAREISLGGGNIHCITQQQPSA